MRITDEMIEQRRLENKRKAQKKWRDANRDKVNAYARAWKAKYKAEHGVSYSIANERSVAERQLRAEMEQN